MYGELVKLKIIGNREADGDQTAKTETFEVQINPSQFKQNYRIAYADECSPGQAGQDAKFKMVEPEQLDLEFIIDGTGVVSNDLDIGGGILGTAMAIADTFTTPESSTYVTDKIDELKRVMYMYEGETHRTPFVTVVWGKLLFEGILLNLDITYTLFQPDGTPLRAKINASFRQQIPVARQPQVTAASPDLTHIRVVNAGDNIQLMTNKLYKDPKYYLEIARVNDLTNFRKLRVGQKLIFPPFKKSD
jgi:hypothetical protein